MTTVARRVEQFFFTPASDWWLTLLRVGCGLQILAYCLTSWADWRHLFVESGAALVGRSVSELFLSGRTALTPRLSWIINLAAVIRLREEQVLPLLGMILLLAGVCLCVGLFTRTTAVIAWFIHLASVKSVGLTSYGMDNFTTIALFYIAIAPLPDRWSLDRIVRKLPGKPLVRHGFHRRVLQLHLCLVYFFSGLTKGLGPEWWNGESVWRALIRPPFNLLGPNSLIAVSALLPLLGISVVVLELGYSVFIWPPKTRRLWLAAIIAMHVGIALTMGLYLFALIMITLNLAAFSPELPPLRRRPKSVLERSDSARPRAPLSAA